MHTDNKHTCQWRGLGICFSRRWACVTAPSGSETGTLPIYGMPGPPHITRRMHQIAISVFTDRLSRIGCEITAVRRLDRHRGEPRARPGDARGRDRPRSRDHQRCHRPTRAKGTGLARGQGHRPARPRTDAHRNRPMHPVRPQSDGAGCAGGDARRARSVRTPAAHRASEEGHSSRQQPQPRPPAPPARTLHRSGRGARPTI